MDMRNIWMIERGQQLRLALETGEPARIVRYLGLEYLDRDISV